MTKNVFFSLIALSVASSASAHQIWIEQDGGKARVFFGEYGANLKETSPGVLKTLPLPKIRIKNAKEVRETKAIKGKDGIDFDAKFVEGDSITAEVQDYPVYVEKEEGKSLRMKWIPAARLAGSPRTSEALNTLDIVPRAEENSFKLIYKGKPLPEAKVALVAPNGWQKEIWTDDKGEFAVAPLWKGLYVVHAEHKDSTPGEMNGEKYDVATFTSTTSFIHAKGSDTIRPAPAKPNPES